MIRPTVPLLPTVIERLERRPSRPGILVAFSGGLDSTVLLHLLTAWSRRSGEALAAVHVDHQLRDSSGADRASCQRMASRLGVPLVVETLDLHRRGSVQESARVQRYALIARAAQRLGLGSVASAHHADDAVETALLNFRRGTSSAGLSSGISPTDRPIPSWPDLELLRPLARTPKRDISAYADEHDLTWQTDPTNAQTNYERNRLRQQVLPTLTDHGDLLGPMLDTLENLASERRAIEAMADACLAKAALTRPDAESVALDCEPLRSTPDAVVAVTLQKLLRQLPAEVGLGRDHLRELVEAIVVPDTVQPDTVQMAVRGGFVSIDRGLLIAEVARGRGGKHLHERVAHGVGLGVGRGGACTEKTAPWFGTRFRFDRREDEAAQMGPAMSIEALGDVPLVVRGPRPGDRLDARGMPGHKSVNDVLAEAGVPRALRWRWPVVARDDQIRDVAWICGLRRANLGVGRDQSGEVASGSHRQLRWDVEPSSVFARVLSRSQNR